MDTPAPSPDELALSTRVQTLYLKLNAIDTKCGGLLQLSSVLLVFIGLDPTRAFLSEESMLQRAVIVALLLSCMLTLYVLWFKEAPDEALLARRIRLFNLATGIASAACAVVATVTVISLLKT
jgi:hypothetical protein